MIIMCARVYENTTRSKKIVNYNCTTFVTSYDLAIIPGAMLVHSVTDIGPHLVSCLVLN